MLLDAVAPVLVSLAFAGGLIPSLVAANKIAFTNLVEQRPELSAPTPGQQSGSPPLASSKFLGYPSPVTVLDVVDVMSRVSADRPTALSAILKQPSDGSRRLVRKDEFELAIKGLPPLCKQMTLVSSNGQVIQRMRPSIGRTPPAALAVDATWAALSANAPYVSPDEVERCFACWRPNLTTFAVEDFEEALLRGRTTVVLGYTILVTIQALVATILVLQPLLEVLRG